jgi:hypothetical protein
MGVRTWSIAGSFDAFHGQDEGDGAATPSLTAAEVASSPGSIAAANTSATAAAC